MQDIISLLVIIIGVARDPVMNCDQTKRAGRDDLNY
jgi:hypothetical protein